MKRELRIMLWLGVKAEIQWIDESGSLTGWLNEQMRGLMHG
jgi:meiotic recombination protein SPO11